MKHTTIHELGARAHVVARDRLAMRVLRRARLERFAGLLDMHEGELQLFSGIEYMSSVHREAVRVDNSALALAFRDPMFRAEGLAGDRLGDAMRFFALTAGETHLLLCDCRYGARSVAAQRIALRAREIAARQSLAERWRWVCNAAQRGWRRLVATS